MICYHKCFKTQIETEIEAAVFGVGVLSHHDPIAPSPLQVNGMTHTT